MIKVKLTGDRAYTILKMLPQIKGVVVTPKFADKMFDIREVLQDQLEKTYKRIIEPPEEYNRYVAERTALMTPYQAAVTESKKNNKDLPDKAAHESKLTELDKKYEATLKLHRENELKNKALFKEENELEFPEISADERPDMPMNLQEVVRTFMKK